MAFPVSYNINYYAGDTYQFVIRPKTSNGDVYPITAGTYTAKFYIAPTRGGLAAGTIEASASISDNAVTCTIFPSVGNSLDPSTTYYFDVSVTKIADATVVHTLMTGSISITDDITPVV